MDTFLPNAIFWYFEFLLWISNYPNLANFLRKRFVMVVNRFLWLPIFLKLYCIVSSNNVTDLTFPGVAQTLYDIWTSTTTVVDTRTRLRLNFVLHCNILHWWCEFFRTFCNFSLITVVVLNRKVITCGVILKRLFNTEWVDRIKTNFLKDVIWRMILTSSRFWRRLYDRCVRWNKTLH